MSTHTDTHETHEHGGPAVYARTLGALIVLTAITVGAAYVDLGAGNVVVALVIATIKATLVALFFMHLKWDKPVNGIIAMAGFLFLGIFLMFDLLDYDSRNNFMPQNLHISADMPLAPGTAPAGVKPALPAPEAAPAAAGDKKTEPAAEKK
ncbi:MAG TPA: cytochrome C oxidase subunit IV family protein [Bryobacteraceae bacterium]|jgi:cytochrome c oxidase subunit 4